VPFVPWGDALAVGGEASLIQTVSLASYIAASQNAPGHDYARTAALFPEPLERGPHGGRSGTVRCPRRVTRTQPREQAVQMADVVRVPGAGPGVLGSEW
jgi:hypothetical protein